MSISAICNTCKKPLYSQSANVPSCTCLPVTGLVSSQSVSMWATLTDANMDALRQMIREELQSFKQDVVERVKEKLIRDINMRLGGMRE